MSSSSIATLAPGTNGVTVEDTIPLDAVNEGVLILNPAIVGNSNSVDDSVGIGVAKTSFTSFDGVDLDTLGVAQILGFPGVHSPGTFGKSIK